ncbi:UNVERIFIED_ORG: deoxyribodipyrimidine photo-lyase [Burkholderia sp. 1595]|uniref:Deoxyribodipyrimidine photo-lyase n=1 Tax=Paraburkholderia terricola TaxID=169427 RepID=A0ABU1LX99_9BURK|nr:deoxyribodipyrimidine photo-lyase [Paraburkholderia terricola]MDR6483180.1 deoxyribodipyrimidine photo-lyase [Paraburkholderia terricola]
MWVFFARSTFPPRDIAPARESPMTRVRRPSDTFNTGLVWFRRDLRSTDNDALYQALKHCERVWCVFMFDTAILQPLIDTWQARHADTQP